MEKDKLKALFEEGRYIFHDNGTVQRTSDMSFIKMIYPSHYGRNAQYNLYTKKYGVIPVTIKEIIDYANKHILA